MLTLNACCCADLGCTRLRKARPPSIYLFQRTTYSKHTYISTHRYYIAPCMFAHLDRLLKLQIQLRVVFCFAVPSTGSGPEFRQSFSYQVVCVDSSCLDRERAHPKTGLQDCGRGVQQSNDRVSSFIFCSRNEHSNSQFSWHGTYVCVRLHASHPHSVLIACLYRCCLAHWSTPCKCYRVQWKCVLASPVCT